MLTIAFSVEQLAFARNILPQLKKINPYFLFISVITNSKESIQLMIDHGADPNSFSKMGWSILHLACLRGANAAIEALLENGANPNLTSVDGRYSTLHKAFDSPGLIIDTLKLLLEKTDNINIRNLEGETLLHSAILPRQ